MKSFILKSIGDSAVVEAQIPERKTGEALIKVKAVSLCGSDVNSFIGRGTHVVTPLVLGHEIAGEILEVEPNEKGFKAGDRVIVEPYINCGECFACKSDRPNCCENLKVLGVQTDGGMSEFITHRVDLLHKLPDQISWEHAPIIEPLVIALHGIHRTKVKAGEFVIVNGAGPIGILAVMALKTYGAKSIVIDILDSRLEKAKNCGANYTINPNLIDPVEELSRITEGHMADVVLEMSGSAIGTKNTLLYAGYLGRIGLTGWPSKNLELETSLITRKELEVLGCRNGHHEFAESIALIKAKKVNPDNIISQVVPFEDLPQAIQNQSHNPEEYLKIVGLI